MAGIFVVVGTRPEAIKLAPVIDALRGRGIPTQICATAQHRELLDRALGLHGFKPDIDLDVMRPGQSVGELTGKMLVALDNVFVAEQPEWVVVQGDTATALAGAQSAYLRNIAVAHVEAGLRTGSLDAPHPEEGNRRMIAAIASLHFAPTATAVKALISEGVNPERVHLTGNTVADALIAMRRRLVLEPDLARAVNGLIHAAGGKRLIIVTCHRRESFAAAPQIAEALCVIADRPDVTVALPLHPNPAIAHHLSEILAGVPNIHLLPPLDFAPFIALLSQAYLVLTDSGGIQEEAPMLGVPALVMRDRTERPEGIEAATARLVGTNAKRIIAETFRLLDNPEEHARMARVHTPYGDGQAADRIAELLAITFGLGRRV
jgi:UDP-N-acetylglucosamine 2-epimerase (non-hydrolysing)